MKRFFVTILCLLSLLVMGCSEEQQQQSNREISVDVKILTECVIGDKQNYVGIVEEGESVALSFEMGGNLKEVLVRPGDQVSEGQLLARLDDTQARSAYEAAQATLAQAEDGHRRAKQLYDNGSLPEVKWVEIQTKLSQAQSVEQIAKRALENCTLYAPTAGVIGLKITEAGTNVLPFVPVMRLMTINQLKVRSSIPENEISKVNLKDKAEITVSAISDEVMEAEVVEKNVKADLLTHSYIIKCLFKKQNKDLMPGMVARVGITLPISKGFIVPAKAVQITPEGPAVWVIENNQARRQMVTIHRYIDTGVLVQSGLSEGDTIVVGGYQKLYHNAVVSINKVVD